MRNIASIMSATPEYGIGVTRNRFALVDIEDEDPLELLKRREQEKEEKRKIKLLEKDTKAKQLPTPKVKPKKIVKESLVTRNTVDAQKNKDEKKIKPRKEPDVLERKMNSGNKPAEDNDRQDSGMAQHENEDRNGYNDGFQRERGRRGNARVFVREGGRGPRGGFSRRSPTFDIRGKREFDRQSGSDKTGVKPMNKRDGSGPHNWGNIQDECANRQEDDWTSPPDEWNNTEEKSESVAKDAGGTDMEGQVTTVEDTNERLVVEGQQEVFGPEDVDLEKQELTLDEWKALKTPREQPKYNVRKPGEGEDLSQWKKMYALEKKKEEEEDSDEYEYEIGDYPQRVGRLRRILDIDIKFKDTRGGGRGGRGFGRGGRGRGGFNASNNRMSAREGGAPAPKVDDEKDFPSLA